MTEIISGKILTDFLNFVRKDHYKEYAKSSYNALMDLKLPFLNEYSTLSDETFFKIIMASTFNLLINPFSGVFNAILEAQDNLETYKANELELYGSSISQKNILFTDLLRIYSIQKQELYKLVPFYTRNGTEIISIVNELEKNYLRVENVVFNHLFKIQKETENKLIKKTAELERSNNDLEKFAYVASHDLQEPLRMIVYYVQLLEEDYKDKLDSNAIDFINFAVDGSKRMKVLIDDLLLYSRVTRPEKIFEKIDLNKPLEEALKNLQLSINETNTKILIKPLPEVSANYFQMVSLFQNIIGNAIKFKGKKDPEININWEKEEGEYLFSIKDNGIGFDQKYAEKIFEVFQRLQTTSNISGTGIGLAICKKIVEGHGGKIWAKSEIGKGSTFFFTLKVDFKIS